MLDRQDPRNFVTLYLLAECEFQLGMYAACIARLISFPEWLAQPVSRIGKLRAAAAERSEQLPPPANGREDTASPRELRDLGRAALKQHQWLAAAHWFEQLEKVAPDQEDVPYRLGVAYFKVGRYEHAAHYLRRAAGGPFAEQTAGWIDKTESAIAAASDLSGVVDLARVAPVVPAMREQSRVAAHESEVAFDLDLQLWVYGDSPESLFARLDAGTRVDHNTLLSVAAERAPATLAKFLASHGLLDHSRATGAYVLRGLMALKAYRVIEQLACEAR